ncbi:cytochrome c oxidase subunit 8A, mitochondrial-like [Kryptolebias marmoratus]|uniref:cytochrome c oxidase subunit 8A, mitochondrial-like n=1 Tax=Kryptolebias marmoratus TaxID=37003 RepID=UPI0007F89F8F|nr:cytochrome c oxidase subunit 8A, mitochondrial-like [Kryptolebias marmoratus]
MTMMSSVLRMMGNASSLTRPKEILRNMNRKIYSKPPRNPIGVTQSFFVMSVFAVTMLTPAAWILHHLPEYRERTQQSPRT